MKDQAYHFEIRDLVSLFCASFDDIIIKRYDVNRVAQSSVQVRYVYAPKQRVIYDLVNKQMNITLPVVAVSVTNVSRDVNRVFNKLKGFTYPIGSTPVSTNTALEYKSPVPVDISVAMSIMTKYQLDMDQIISNFAPYNNPYIVLSWQVPNDVTSQGFSTPLEIRSNVIWSGNVNLQYPTDINATEKYKVVADTSFIIKGWLFPATNDNPSGIIYKIDANFYDADLLTDYDTLTSQSYTYPLSSGLVSDMDVVTLSAVPQILNVSFGTE